MDGLDGRLLPAGEDFFGYNCSCNMFYIMLVLMLVAVLSVALMGQKGRGLEMLINTINK